MCRPRHCPPAHSRRRGSLGAGRVWACLGGPCHEPGTPGMKPKAVRAGSPAEDRGQLWLHNTALVIFKRLMMQFKISLECSPTHTRSPLGLAAKGTGAAWRPQIERKRGGMGRWALKVEDPPFPPSPPPSSPGFE